MTIVQLLINALLLSGTYLLLAVGLNLIFGVMRVVNFAHGGMMVFSGLLVYWLIMSANLNVVFAVVVGVAAVGLIGFLSQAFALERIRAHGYGAELLSLLVTYGISLMLINVGTIIFGADFVSLPNLQGSWRIGEFTFGRAQVLSAVVGVVFSLAVLVWLGYTSSGKRLKATSQSIVGAEVSGVNATLMKRIAFAVGSALAALAGALTIFQSAFDPSSGLNYTVLAFVMIALGGLGSYRGAFVGAIGLALVSVFVAYYLGGAASALAPYILLFIVMFARTRQRGLTLA